MAEARIVVIGAHPYPSRSRGHRALADAVRDLPGVELRELYDRYPDFDIDVAAEQQTLEGARLVVWLTPLYWYGVPAMMKHWFDRVLLKGWAHGEGGTALEGKQCLWCVTTGGSEDDYAPSGRHLRPFSQYTPPIEHTARYCGMQWLAPLVVHAVNQMPEDRLLAAAATLRARVAETGTG